MGLYPSRRYRNWTSTTREVPCGTTATTRVTRASRRSSWARTWRRRCAFRSSASSRPCACTGATRGPWVSRWPVSSRTVSSHEISVTTERIKLRRVGWDRCWICRPIATDETSSRPPPPRPVHGLPIWSTQWTGESTKNVCFGSRLGVDFLVGLQQISWSWSHCTVTS